MTIRFPPSQSNPPDPQVPPPPAPPPIIGESAPASANNPPNPQVPGISPFGEADDLLTQPGQDAFQNELEQARLAQERESRDFLLRQQAAQDDFENDLEQARLAQAGEDQEFALREQAAQDDFENELEQARLAQEREAEEFGLREQAAQDDFENELEQARLAQERENADFIAGRIPNPVNPAANPQVPQGIPFDDEGNLNPGFTLDGDGQPVFVGDDFIDPSLTASAEASRAAARQAATLANARQQATIQSQRKQGNDTDWRVRLSLAPQANYLYKAPDVGGQPGSGILAPLARTDGVIFPYTPRITTAYAARYSSYDLTHSNYRGYFYQGSHLDDVNIEATFTAQDTAEAEYLLAVIHFFRSVTKMFYGQDPIRGTPPPVVYLRGLGEYQYNLHPCVVAQFNYNLPNDVDYIRARSKNTVPVPGSLLQRRQRESVPTNVFSSALQRLSAAGLRKGAQPAPPPVPSLGIEDATYVPTKLDMSIILKPMQSREQVSRQFSLQQYANGDLLKGGFW